MSINYAGKPTTVLLSWRWLVMVRLQDIRDKTSSCLQARSQGCEKEKTDKSTPLPFLPLPSP